MFMRVVSLFCLQFDQFSLNIRPFSFGYTSEISRNLWSSPFSQLFGREWEWSGGSPGKQAAALPKDTSTPTYTPSWYVSPSETEKERWARGGNRAKSLDCTRMERTAARVGEKRREESYLSIRMTSYELSPVLKIFPRISDCFLVEHSCR